MQGMRKAIASRRRGEAEAASEGLEVCFWKQDLHLRGLR